MVGDGGAVGGATATDGAAAATGMRLYAHESIPGVVMLRGSGPHMVDFNLTGQMPFQQASAAGDLFSGCCHEREATIRNLTVNPQLCADGFLHGRDTANSNAPCLEMAIWAGHLGRVDLAARVPQAAGAW
jgi:hypothetical protein